MNTYMFFTHALYGNITVRIYIATCFILIKYIETRLYNLPYIWRISFRLSGLWMNWCVVIFSIMLYTSIASYRICYFTYKSVSKIASKACFKCWVKGFKLHVHGRCHVLIAFTNGDFAKTPETQRTICAKWPYC